MGGEIAVSSQPGQGSCFSFEINLEAVDPQIEQFRWLLEELRVGLFAQELRTPVPVSVKRLEKQWEGIKHG